MDCMLLEIRETSIEKDDPSVGKQIYLPTKQYSVDLEKRVVTTRKGKVRKLLRAATNNRLDRKRPESLYKRTGAENFALRINGDGPLTNTFAEEQHAYGK